MWVR